MTKGMPVHWVIAAAALLAVGLIIDQLAVWAAKREWIYWRNRRPTPASGAAAGALGEMQALLSPSYRHVIDESQAKQTLRVDQATGDGHRIAIDLNSRTAHVQLPSRGDDDYDRDDIGR